MPPKGAKAKKQTKDPDDDNAVDELALVPTQRPDAQQQGQVYVVSQDQITELVHAIWDRVAQHQRQQSRIAAVFCGVVKVIATVAGAYALYVVTGVLKDAVNHWIKESAADGELRRELAEENPELMFPSGWSVTTMVHYAVQAYGVVAVAIRLRGGVIDAANLVKKAYEWFGTKKIEQKEGEKKEDEKKEEASKEPDAEAKKTTRDSKQEPRQKVQRRPAAPSRRNDVDDDDNSDARFDAIWR